MSVSSPKNATAATSAPRLRVSPLAARVPCRGCVPTPLPHKAAAETLQIRALPNPRPPPRSRHLTCARQRKNPKLLCPESSGRRKSCKIRPEMGDFFWWARGIWGGGMLRRVAGAGRDGQGQDGNCLACPSQRYPMENHHPKETPQIPNAPFHPGKAFGVSRSWDFPLPTQTSRAFVHPPSTLSSLQAISPSPKAKRPPEISGNVPTGSGHSGDAPVTAPASRKLPGTAGTGRSRGHPSARATPTSTRCPLQGRGTPSLVSPWWRCPLLTPGIVSAPPRHGVFWGENVDFPSLKMERSNPGLHGAHGGLNPKEMTTVFASSIPKNPACLFQRPPGCIQDY